MYDIELEIRKRDWLYIVAIGVAFGALLSLLLYRLLHLPIVEGLLFGALAGCCITLYSLLFITMMNRVLLPRVAHRYWVVIAVLFSFLAGFLGAYNAFGLSSALHLLVPESMSEARLQIAAGVGVLTYIVGALLYRFVKMRNEKELIDHHYALSRLRSLETQLNPHFLFNALNSVAELIHTDADKAEEALLGISSFLRNTMQERALLSLESELRNVRDYLALENLRFDGQILLHVSVNPEDLRRKVPKFSVQLLVENAIKHGFSNRPLHIKVTMDGAVLRVENDGAPMSKMSFGIGLRNLQERLERLCNGALEVGSFDPPVFHIILGACHEPTDRR
ncbi:MAG: histidine kinase [Campylobacterales bacterium]|nr:histidine kinase [Campylobacterales bacterium]